MLPMEKREREREEGHIPRGKKTTNIQDRSILGKVSNGGGDGWRGWATQVKREMRRMK